MTTQVPHEVLELLQVLNCKCNFSELRASDVVEEGSNIGVSDNSIEENVQLALQVHQVKKCPKSTSKTFKNVVFLTFTKQYKTDFTTLSLLLSTTWRCRDNHRSGIETSDLCVCCSCKERHGKKNQKLHLRRAVRMS